jgi:tRNA(Ile)-lysidine synthase
MKYFERQVLKTIKKYQLILPGDVIVAAVSGGPDSVAMLHVILRLTAGWGVDIRVAHLNHMFRGAQSDEEADFVQQLASSWGLPCTVEKRDVPAYIRQTGTHLKRQRGIYAIDFCEGWLGILGQMAF